MENKHFIIFIGVILIVLMLFSLNKEDSTSNITEQTVENNDVAVQHEPNYAKVNNNFNNNSNNENYTHENETTTKKHIVMPSNSDEDVVK
jgi:predicted RND superfamily exporter protein